MVVGRGRPIFLLAIADMVPEQVHAGFSQLRIARGVIGHREIGRGIAAFLPSVQHEMQEGIEASGGDVGILLQVEIGIERRAHRGDVLGREISRELRGGIGRQGIAGCTARMHAPSLGLAVQHPMAERVDA